MGTAPQLELAGISLRYGERVALRDIDLGVAPGQLVSLLGPSGSGKSSLLRVVAGLERPVSGAVRFEGRDITGTPAHERGFGLMFQDYALFPHRDVAGNVGFGPRMQGWPEPRVRARIAEMLALVGLPGIDRRPVSQLSGGEQQRVALARALAPGPRLLMLDEPMGSLDRALRERLPIELRAIFEQLGVTVLYVTHDQEEALGVADRVVLLRDGRIEADASPQVLWSAPRTVFTARFLGFRNVIEAVVRGGVATTRVGWFEVSSAPDGPASIVLPSDAVRLDQSGSVAGAVIRRRFRGDHLELAVRVAAPEPLELELIAQAESAPNVGDEVRVELDRDRAIAIPDRVP
jgi:thiamine transport system ATP-binding protein